MIRNRRVTPFLLLALLCAGAVPAAAQTDVLLEKFTNGQDANLPPGPFLLVGSTVNWTYVVTNTGGRDLGNVTVTDDQGVTVTCPATTLGAGLSMTCTASGTVVSGQYANVGTASAEISGPGTPVSDSDPSHYFGQAAPAVTLQKSTEGFDADTPPGPSLPAGSTVNWTYVVTNVGTDSLFGITVTDDQGVSVTCPAADLAPGGSMTCTASGTAQVGQYANLGSVSAFLPNEDPVGASDPSHYFGQVLLLEKATNGQDADFPPGPTLLPGTAVTWTYTVTNPGPATVTGLVVTDDQGVTVTCPATTLGAGLSMTCTASGTAQPGPYANLGTATAQLPAGGTVTATDPSHYFGNVLDLQKATNGQDADLPPGPVVAVGSPIVWTYLVTNLGSVGLANVTVVDSQGVTVTCPGTTLTPAASMTCTASGTAAPGQYSNIGLATADHPTLGEVGASDPSHYFGQDQVLDFGDAADPTHPTTFASDGARHLLGSSVYLGACVDSELDGQPNAGATGDDLGAGISTFGTCAVAGDDEDGVTLTTQLVASTTAAVSVVANAACTLSAWIDFNLDGDWIDAGEDLFPGGAALSAGTNSLTFPVPAATATGTAAARFRCTTQGTVAFTGEAPDGEVEDYRLAVAATPAAVSAAKTVALVVDQNGDGTPNQGETLLYTILLQNSGGAIATSVVFTDTPDANTALVVGSVTTTAGSVVIGNTAGDTSVQVNVGTLAGGGGSATITFRVTLDDPLSPGVTQVSNQGLVTGANFTATATDDPVPPGSADPTAIAVRALSVVEIPALGAWGAAALLLLLAGLAVSRLRRRGARGAG